MKRVQLFLFVIFSCIFLSQAQNKQMTDCGFDVLHQNQLENNPVYKKNFEANKSQWKDYAISKANNTTTKIFPATGVTLPVVFYDISADGTTHLLSSATNTITDYHYILNSLNSHFTNANIGFCLSQQDINGDSYDLNDTNVVHSDSDSLVSGNNTMMGNITTAANIATLPETNYINIYIVDNIDGNTAGFATFPASHGSNIDGIYIERQFLDTTNLGQDIKVLVHEMGHYLGLYHTFYPSCDNFDCISDGDMICDTPPHTNPQNLSPIGNCTNNITNTCNDLPVPTISDGTHPTIEVNDPVNNYMNYTAQACQTEFTNGQILKMQLTVDPDDGSRKSLLNNNNVCISCVNLDNCDFTITPNPTNLVNNISPVRNYIEQSSNVTFNADNNCNNTNITYTWTLVNLDTNAPLQIGVPTINTLGLAVGNYNLILTATDTINNLCFETASYLFTIINSDTSCTNVEFPVDNIETSWNISGWDRISYSGGEWFGPGTADPTPDPLGFEVIPITPGSDIPSDPNFAGINLPATANIDRVIRVGRQWDGAASTGGGRAHYVQRTITITPENSRFRVWYLGGTQGSSGNTRPLFYNTSSVPNDAAFGWLCEYEYNSTVRDVSSNALNTTIGSSYNSGTNSEPYTRNDLISLNQWYGLSDRINNYSNVNGLNRGGNWKSKILDFSEFATLNPNTEVTLTFFEHSNNTVNALQNAYAYFGIECLGGGLPRPFTLEDIPDVYLDCQPSPFFQVDISIPPPAYCLRYRSDSYVNYNFINIRLELENTDGTFSPKSFNYLLPHLMRFLIDKDDPDANGDTYTSSFRNFRITYNTLHDTFTDEFRVFLGPVTEALCTNGGDVDDSFYTNNTNYSNGEFVACVTAEDFEEILHLTPSCIETNFSDSFVRYEWYYFGSKIANQTGDTLGVTTQGTSGFFSLLPYSNELRYRFQRRTIYIDPVCGGELSVRSEWFTIYNLSKITFSRRNITSPDICYTHTNNDIIRVELNNIKLSRSVGIPNNFGIDYNNNNIEIQLITDNGDPIGDPINYTYSGSLGNHVVDLPGSNPGEVVFNVLNRQDQLDPTSPPIFVPTQPGQSFNIRIQVTGIYGDCEITPIEGPLTNITMTPTALGGEITYNCNAQEIVNNNTVSNWTLAGQYGWEYEQSPNVFVPIPNAPTTSNLPILSTYYNLTSSLNIRRVSYGASDCPIPSEDYTNVITVTPRPNVDSLPDITECNSYTLPALTHGNYYTAANGTGAMLNTGDNITASQTVYIYAHTVNTLCTNESSFIVTIENCPDCIDCKDYGEQIILATLANTAECDKYTLEIPQDINDCYIAELLVNGAPINLSLGTNLITFNQVNNTVELYLYDENGDVCFRDLQSIEVDCCKDCDTEYADELQDRFWKTLEEDREKCGLYLFQAPEIEDDCYEVHVNWGDGQTDVLTSTDSGTSLYHEYTTDITTSICVEIYVDGELCGRKRCKEIEVDCCKDCDDKMNYANFILNQIQPSNDCNKFYINPNDIQDRWKDCYDGIFQLNWGDGTTTIVDPFTPNGISDLLHNYPVTNSSTAYYPFISIFDGSDDCQNSVRRRDPLVVDCPVPCDCDAIQINYDLSINEETCEYTFEIKLSPEECVQGYSYALSVNGNSTVYSNSNTITYTFINGGQYDIALVANYTSDDCDDSKVQLRDTIEVECAEPIDCRRVRCNERYAASMVDFIISNSIYEECYIELPRFEIEPCYEVFAFWGDGQVENITNRASSHDYSDRQLLGPIVIEVRLLDGTVCYRGEYDAVTCRRSSFRSQELKFTMSPNPASNKITVSSSMSTITNKPMLLLVKDIQGNVLHKDNNFIETKTVDVSKFNAGVYFVTLQLNNGQLKTKKLIINK